MVKVIVGMMGSSVGAGSSSMATTTQVEDFLSTVASHNVKELDTARVYNGGKSEELLGAVHADRQFAISTKAPAFSAKSLTEANIIANCNKSLAALGVSQVDIYYLHGPDRATPLEEQCRAIGQLYKEGKFRRFGVSNLRDDEVQTIHDICAREGYPRPTVYQGGYSPLHRKSETTLFPLLRRLDMAFYAFSPLAGGLLAKRIADITNPAEGSRYAAMPAFGDLFLKPDLIAGLEKLTRLCDDNDITTMEATLRWFMHHSPLGSTDGVILGASKTAQVEATLSACEKGPLPAALVQGFETLWKEVEHVAPGYS